jgi:hypothetical protein
VVLAGCGSSAPPLGVPTSIASPASTATPLASIPSTPAALFSPTPVVTASPTDPVDLVTYEPSSACASVQVTTRIDKLPPACAAAWRPYGVVEVPGQDAMKRTPHFPQVLAPNGVNSTTAIRLAIAMWRTETFQAYSLGTRQLHIVDGLGQNYLMRHVGGLEREVEKGNSVSTPMCHFFPTQIHIVPLAHDYASHVHRPDGFLGVQFTYTGPCYATSTDKNGNKTELFRFDGQRSVMYVGDIGRGDPLGPVLVLSTFGECNLPQVKPTCAQ